MGLHTARRPGQLRRVDGRAGAGAHAEQARCSGVLFWAVFPPMEGWAGVVFMQVFYAAAELQSWRWQTQTAS